MAGMFGSARPTASLSPSLLARKGQARPAMRPHGFAGQSVDVDGDLGWNDMGQDNSHSEAAPPVLVERQRLVEEFQAPAPVAAAVAPEPEAVAPTPAPVATAKRIKAAFTLRLDRERHLRLRLASTLRHRSAQHLVTEALDNYLKTLPEVEMLARHVPDAGDLTTGGKS